MLIGDTVGTATQLLPGKTIEANGDVAISAASSGVATNVIVSKEVGSAKIEATENTRAIVGGVSIAAGGLNIDASSASSHTAKSLEANTR